MVKQIKFELKELKELRRLLEKSIIESDQIGYIVEKVPLYSKIHKAVKELDELSIPF